MSLPDGAMQRSESMRRSPRRRPSRNRGRRKLRRRGTRESGEREVARCGFTAFGDEVEVDLLSFGQRLQSRRAHGSDVNENILAAIGWANEAVTLGLVEPLDRTRKPCSGIPVDPSPSKIPRGAAPRESNRRRADRRIDDRIPSAVGHNYGEYFSTALDTGHEVARRVNWGPSKNGGHPAKKSAARYLKSTVAEAHAAVSEQGKACAALSRYGHQAFHSSAVGAVACAHSHGKMTTLVLHDRDAEIALRLLIDSAEILQAEAQIDVADRAARQQARRSRPSGRWRA